MTKPCERLIELFLLFTVLAAVAHAQSYATCGLGDVWQPYLPSTLSNCKGTAFIGLTSTISGGGTQVSGPFTITAASTTGPDQPPSATIVFNPSATAYGPYQATVHFSYQFYTFTVTTTATYDAIDVFNPAYKVVSIIYAPPGNKSSNGFNNSTTDGSTTTIGNTFMYGQSITFTEGIKAFGSSGGVGETFGISQSTSNSTAFTETFTDTEGVSNASLSSNPDAINHNQDLFLIWLNPQVTVMGVPPTPSDYSVSVQPTANGKTPLPDVLEVTALVMEPNSAGASTVPPGTLIPQTDPETGQSVPGLAIFCKKLKVSEYNASACTLADQCGCTPADFAPILQQDPLLYYNGLSKPISPYPNTASPLLADTAGEAACNTLPITGTNECRYVPVPSGPGSTTPETTYLAGPSCAGCNNNPNAFMQGENQSTMVTEGESSTESVGFTVKAGTPVFSVSVTDTWSWTQSESIGTATGSGVQLAVSLNSGTVGCEQSEIPVYEDTVYHTFVFQQPGGAAGATCTTATTTPTFSPAAGTYDKAQTVTISSSTVGATIYYTTNGSTPTTSSTKYAGPITVSATKTVKAISSFPGWSRSSVGSAQYTIK